MTTTWDPAKKSTGTTLSNGNLTGTYASGGNQNTQSVDAFGSGKFYFEYVITATNGNESNGVGLATTGAGLNTDFVGYISTTSIGAYADTGNIYNSSTLGALSPAPTLNSVMGVAFDSVNKKVWFRPTITGNWNGAAIGSQNPATNTGGYSTAALSPTTIYAAFTLAESGNAGTARFSSASWTGTPPAGFGEINPVVGGTGTFASTGAATVAFSGVAYRIGSMASTGSSTFSPVGAGTTTTVSLAAAGVGTAAFGATAILPAVMNVAGASAFSAFSGTAAVGSMASTAAGVFNAVGRTTAVSTLTTSGSAVFTAPSTSTTGAVLTVAGTSTFNIAAGTIAAGAWSSSGVSTFALSGSTTITGTLGVAGTSVFTPNSVNVSVMVMSSVPSSAFSAVGQRTIEVVFNANGLGAFSSTGLKTATGVLSAAGHGVFNGNGAGNGALTTAVMHAVGSSTFSPMARSFATGVLSITAVSNTNYFNSTSYTAGERLIWPHPQFWDGFNDVEIACDEVNGHGLNPEMMPPIWDSSNYSRGTVMAGENNTDTNLPNEGGMRPSVHIRPETRTILIKRDSSRVRVLVE